MGTHRNFYSRSGVHTTTLPRQAKGKGKKNSKERQLIVHVVGFVGGCLLVHSGFVKWDGVSGNWGSCYMGNTSMVWKTESADDDVTSLVL